MTEYRISDTQLEDLYQALINFDYAKFQGIVETVKKDAIKTHHDPFGGALEIDEGGLDP